MLIHSNLTQLDHRNITDKAKKHQFVIIKLLIKPLIALNAKFFRRYPYIIMAILFSEGCLQSTKDIAEKTGTINAALWELANGSEAANEYEKAASYFDRIYQSDPKSKKALLGYTRNLRYLGLPKESIKTIRNSLENFVDDSDLRLEMAKSQLAASLIRDAETTLKKIAEEEPKRWEVYSALGIIYDRLQNYRKAQKSYKQALELSPNNTDVTNNLALSLAQSGNLNKAIKLLEIIVSSEKSSVQTRQNLALLYGLNGQLNKARNLSKADLTHLTVEKNILAFKELHASDNPIDSQNVLSVTKNIIEPNISKIDARQHHSQHNTPAIYGVYFTLSETSVYKGPAINSKPVGRLKKGDEVILLGHSQDKQWRFVEISNGKRGYIDHKIIRKTQPLRKTEIVGQQDQ